jgi:hypothetical protein
MRIIVCFEYEGIDCNSDFGTELLDIITSDLERMQNDFEASDCYVMEADDNDMPPDRTTWEEDDEEQI